MRIFANKQDNDNKMNTANSFDTISLLHTQADGVHLIYHNIYRLLKPARRKYNIKCNELLLLNGIYIYHKYINVLFTIRQAQKFTGYFNPNKYAYYFNSLLSLGFIEYYSIIRGNKHYRITLAGLDVINYFNSTYQEQLSKWLQDHKIDL